jgi:hypothetical protein
MSESSGTSIAERANTVDQRGVDEPVTQRGMYAAAEPVVELGHRDEQRPGFEDRVAAEVGPGPVRGQSDDLDLGPDEATVRGGDLELGRFGDDRGVNMDPIEDLRRPEARVLLIGDIGDDHLARQSKPVRLSGGDERGGKTGLHVVGAATVQAVTVDDRDERRRHSTGTDRVEVPTQQKGTAQDQRGVHRIDRDQLR